MAGETNASTMMKKTEKRNPYLGSSVDDFFAADGLLNEIEAVAIKCVIALELQQELDRKQMTKTLPTQVGSFRTKARYISRITIVSSQRQCLKQPRNPPG